MEPLIWISIITVLGLLIGKQYRKRWYPVNDRLFEYLDRSNFREVASALEVSSSITGAWSSAPHKLYSDGTAITLTDPYELDLNRNSKRYAQTYLLVHPSNLESYPRDLFRNVLLTSSLNVDSKRDLTIKGSLFGQTSFRKLSWQHSYDIRMKIKRFGPLPGWKELIEFPEAN